MKKCRRASRWRNQCLVQRRFRKKRIRVLIKAGKIDRATISSSSSVVIAAPEVLSITKNGAETLKFLRKIKLLGRRLALLNNQNVRGTFFRISLSGVTRISVRSAVILATEIDRFRRLTGISLRYSSRDRGQEDVSSVLAELGAFELSKIPADEARGEHTESRITLIKLQSGRRLEENSYKNFERSLKEIFADFHSIPPLYEGMSEALLNVVNHAYSIGQLKYPCPGCRWWSTACIDMEAGELRIFVFDQGVGIPATLPHSGALEWVQGLVTGALSGSFGTDETLLKAALEYARTRTGVAGRGKGFKDILSAIEPTTSGRLRIASGCAEVSYSSSGELTSRPLDAHVGGTLIEWTLPISVFNRDWSS